MFDVSQHDSVVSKVFVLAINFPASQVDFVVYKTDTNIHINYCRLIKNNTLCAKCIKGQVSHFSGFY